MTLSDILLLLGCFVVGFTITYIFRKFRTTKPNKKVFKSQAKG